MLRGLRYRNEAQQMNTLYELTTWRDNDLIGSVLFTTNPDSDLLLAEDWCERFILGVDHDRAELSIVHPAVITTEGGSMTRSRVVRTWGD